MRVEMKDKFNVKINKVNVIILKNRKNPFPRSYLRHFILFNIIKSGMSQKHKTELIHVQFATVML